MLNALPFLERDLGGLTPAARFRRALAAVDELIYAEIAERRSGGDTAERDDVLSLLLRARPRGRLADDRRGAARRADHACSPPATRPPPPGSPGPSSGCSRTPRVMERLCASLDDEAYLDAVVKETLRLRPVMVDVARKLTREIELGGWRLPAGTLVLPAIAARARTSRPVPAARRAPARALPRRQGGGVRVAPVRRRRPALHRGRRSLRWRCARCSARCCAACGCGRRRSGPSAAYPARDRGAGAWLPRDRGGAVPATSSA